jgi:hypothetical protein
MPVTPNTLLYLSTLSMIHRFQLSQHNIPHTTAAMLLLSAEWYWIKWYFMDWQMPISDWDWKLFLLICGNYSFTLFPRLGRQFNMPITKHTAYHDFANITFSEKLYYLQVFPYLVIYNKESCIIMTVSIFLSTPHFHENF